ncbi:IPT/TIG domain-containing protein (plasmid) [Ensifer adhaerens]|uniref:IPT/TIG domain-containing protein n=1 Tax=Ensifer adhaerens TaxID=106592 RepID=UPI001CC0FB85|nr:IPT/TIG domain-containing protein [Ensifer adhaerens]MBZ7927312.1 IPT/TIG domain-containing protein [Ensifer adhaerens]UAX98324.1 IPT/TIG domain-containing protein [Ensifer adhaerens]UAY05707.1 IPT/TIG domain-containing protein [Ensifer adhaerens]UAY13085.1 IPT/TIG domain-containing protein [Ensifer adhaerens]
MKAWSAACEAISGAVLPGVFGFVRAGAIALSLWLASALAAQAACTWDVAFTFVGQTKTINTNDCELAAPDGTYGSFYDSPTVDIQSGYGLGANDAGISVAEQRSGSNGGNYEFTFNVSNSVLQIKLLTAPPSGSDSFTGYMYTGNPSFRSDTPATINFTYGPTPTLTAVTPASGPTGGGTTVVITGTNLSGATAVTFGGTAAAGYTVNSATQITATAPARSAGFVNVVVTTSGGTATLTGGYTYVAAPTVTSVSPATGPTGGGTTIIITGTGFSAANATGAVKFGTTNATYTINSATQITATAPANSAGTYDITVTTPGGTSATSANDQYTYVSAPTVTSTSPTSGPTGGGTTVTITGTGFSAASGTGAVKFGATTATYTINSNTQITATAPANSAGTYDITVTTPGGTSATSASDQ